MADPPSTKGPFVKFQVSADSGTRQIVLTIDAKDGVPDLTAEESNSEYRYRPLMLELYYASEGDGKLTLMSVETISRRVSKETGHPQVGTRRTFRHHYTDLTGKGGIHKAVTPPWIVELNKKYGSNPDALPRP